MNQRWLCRVNTWRSPDELIDPRRYAVRPIPDDTTARAFVEEHHYSASYPAARFRFGLFEQEALVGVAVFSHPMNDAVLTELFGGRAEESVELGRFVLLDSVPGNGETWFLGRIFRQLKPLGLRGVVAHSDPLPRIDAAGRVVKPGHIGTIYQAFNADYRGRTRPRRIWVLKRDGRTVPERALSKVRQRERGWQAVVERLLPYESEAALDPEQFDLERFLRQHTYPLRHPGNHRYVWWLAAPRPPLLVTVYPKKEG
jgi:hypothetical protein